MRLNALIHIFTQKILKNFIDRKLITNNVIVSTTIPLLTKSNNVQHEIN